MLISAPFGFELGLGAELGKRLTDKRQKKITKKYQITYNKEQKTSNRRKKQMKNNK